MQQFYRPSGASTQLEGVKSDIVLPSLTTHLPVGESDLDHAIPFDKVPQAAYLRQGARGSVIAALGTAAMSMYNALALGGSHVATLLAGIAALVHFLDAVPSTEN